MTTTDQTPDAVRAGWVRWVRCPDCRNESDEARKACQVNGGRCRGAGLITKWLPYPQVNGPWTEVVIQGGRYRVYDD